MPVDMFNLMFNHKDTLRTASWQAVMRGAKRFHLCGPNQVRLTHSHCPSLYQAHATAARDKTSRQNLVFIYDRSQNIRLNTPHGVHSTHPPSAPAWLCDPHWVRRPCLVARPAVLYTTSNGAIVTALLERLHLKPSVLTALFERLYCLCQDSLVYRAGEVDTFAPDYNKVNRAVRIEPLE
jgi:hypothetical protein